MLRPASESAGSTSTDNPLARYEELLKRKADLRASLKSMGRKAPLFDSLREQKCELDGALTELAERIAAGVERLSPSSTIDLLVRVGLGGGSLATLHERLRCMADLRPDAESLPQFAGGRLTLDDLRRVVDVVGWEDPVIDQLFRRSLAVCRRWTQPGHIYLWLLATPRQLARIEELLDVPGRIHLAAVALVAARGLVNAAGPRSLVGVYDLRAQVFCLLDRTLESAPTPDLLGAIADEAGLDAASLVAWLQDNAFSSPFHSAVLAARVLGRLLVRLVDTHANMSQRKVDELLDRIQPAVAVAGSNGARPSGAPTYYHRSSLGVLVPLFDHPDPDRQRRARKAVDAILGPIGRDPASGQTEWDIASMLAALGVAPGSMVEDVWRGARANNPVILAAWAELLVARSALPGHDTSRLEELDARILSRARLRKSQQSGASELNLLLAAHRSLRVVLGPPSIHLVPSGPSLDPDWLLLIQTKAPAEDAPGWARLRYAADALSRFVESEGGPLGVREPWSEAHAELCTIAGQNTMAPDVAATARLLAWTYAAREDQSIFGSPHVGLDAMRAVAALPGDWLLAPRPAVAACRQWALVAVGRALSFVSARSVLSASGDDIDHLRRHVFILADAFARWLLYSIGVVEAARRGHGARVVDALRALLAALRRTLTDHPEVGDDYLQRLLSASDGPLRVLPPMVRDRSDKGIADTVDFLLEGVALRDAEAGPRRATTTQFLGVLFDAECHVALLRRLHGRAARSETRALTAAALHVWDAEAAPDQLGPVATLLSDWAAVESVRPAAWAWGTLRDLCHKRSIGSPLWSNLTGPTPDCGPFMGLAGLPALVALLERCARFESRLSSVEQIAPELVAARALHVELLEFSECLAGHPELRAILRDLAAVAADWLARPIDALRMLSEGLEAALARVPLARRPGLRELLAPVWPPNSDAVHVTLAPRWGPRGSREIDRPADLAREQAASIIELAAHAGWSDLEHAAEAAVAALDDLRRWLGDGQDAVPLSTVQARVHAAKGLARTMPELVDRVESALGGLAPAEWRADAELFCRWQLGTAEEYEEAIAPALSELEPRWRAGAVRALTLRHADLTVRPALAPWSDVCSLVSALSQLCQVAEWGDLASQWSALQKRWGALPEPLRPGWQALATYDGRPANVPIEDAARWRRQAEQLQAAAASLARALGETLSRDWFAAIEEGMSTLISASDDVEAAVRPSVGHLSPSMQNAVLCALDISVPVGSPACARTRACGDHPRGALEALQLRSPSQSVCQAIDSLLTALPTSEELDASSSWPSPVGPFATELAARADALERRWLPFAELFGNALTKDWGDWIERACTQLRRPARCFEDADLMPVPPGRRAGLQRILAQKEEGLAWSLLYSPPKSPEDELRALLLWAGHLNGVAEKALWPDLAAEWRVLVRECKALTSPATLWPSVAADEPVAADRRRAWRERPIEEAVQVAQRRHALALSAGGAASRFRAALGDPLGARVLGPLAEILKSLKSPYEAVADLTHGSSPLPAKRALGEMEASQLSSTAPPAIGVELRARLSYEILLRSFAHVEAARCGRRVADEHSVVRGVVGFFGSGYTQATLLLLTLTGLAFAPAFGDSLGVESATVCWIPLVFAPIAALVTPALLMLTAWRERGALSLRAGRLALPRMWAANMIGITALALTDESWGNVHAGSTWALHAAWVVFAGLAFAYLLWEVDNAGRVRSGPLRTGRRAARLWVTAMNQCITLAIGAALLVGPPTIARLKVSPRAAPPFFGLLPPTVELPGDFTLPVTAVMFMSASAMFIGLVLQVMWEERPLSDGLG